MAIAAPILRLVAASLIGIGFGDAAAAQQMAQEQAARQRAESAKQQAEAEIERLRRELEELRWRLPRQA